MYWNIEYIRISGRWRFVNLLWQHILWFRAASSHLKKKKLYIRWNIDTHLSSYFKDCRMWWKALILRGPSACKQKLSVIKRMNILFLCTEKHKSYTLSFQWYSTSDLSQYSDWTKDCIIGFRSTVQTIAFLLNIACRSVKYEGYSESNHRFAVTKSNKVSYKV